MNSLTLYGEARASIQGDPNASYWQKNVYMQIITTIFYELLTEKKSPLLSKFCADKGIIFAAKNFSITPVRPSYLQTSSIDMYITLWGLNVALTKNLAECARLYDEQAFQNIIFRDQNLDDQYKSNLREYLQMLDDSLNKFQPVEKFVEVEKPAPPVVAVNEDVNSLFKALDETAQNRKSDDEKIVSEIKKVQQTLQDSLKQIADIRDDIDYRTLKEPIYQLIQLYHKIDDNVKRHPAADKDKGYTSLIKRCGSFLKYVTQSLKMLGVELIDETGGTFDPNKNKVADGVTVSLDSIVEKIVKIGFIYKGTVIEKAEVEISTKPAQVSTSTISIRNFFGR